MNGGRIAGAMAITLIAVAGAAAQEPAVIEGTAGDDRLFGTPGPDAMYGGPGRDTLEGGAGDDQLDGGPGADVLRGGPGFDAVLYGSEAGVTVRLDGRAGDGAGGEGDRVAGDVEAVHSGAGSDTLTGDGRDNVLDGGAGDDALDGGAGSDGLYGGSGDDRVNGIDGAVDDVDCGDGEDFATVDRADRTVGCERVAVAAPPRVRATVRAAWAVAGDGRAYALRIRVARIPRGARIEVRCNGSGCRYAQRRVSTGNRSAIDAARGLGGARVRPSAVVDVRITLAGATGRVVRYTRFSRTGVRRRTLCLPPGATRPRGC